MADFAATVANICRDGIDITYRETGVLMRIAAGKTDAERSAKAIIGCLNMSGSTVSRIGSRLEERGLVTLHRNRRDDRSRIYKLTPQGEAFVKRLNGGFTNGEEKPC